MKHKEVEFNAILHCVNVIIVHNDSAVMWHFPELDNDIDNIMV